MLECPNCHQAIEREAIACPYCGTELKAFGHHGIPLYRASTGEFLCTTCTYHQDDSCTFPQRPYAKTCTLYHDLAEPLFVETQNTYSSNMARFGTRWLSGPAIALLSIAIVSLILVLLGH